MKKYFSPSLEIKQALYYNILAGSPDAYKEVGGSSQFGNETVFDDTEDINPQNGKSFWDDAE